MQARAVKFAGVRHHNNAFCHLAHFAIQTGFVFVVRAHAAVEIDGVNDQIAREALTLAAAKLPIKTRFVARIAE